ncbi:NAD(P)H-hydrate dehydratase [Joostella sp. CR20]|uniref:NAD(P)H-hydrate dehydratase n=1 Tax=Joostella sp. CR20 TaxID=2804312 RepID=UPI00313E75DC
MKIFSSEQIRLVDKLTIEKQNISSADLMERAGTAVFNWMQNQLTTAQVKIHIFCGVGNNGGDGLVVGRQLLESGYNVSVYVVNFSEHRSKDFLLNYDRIKGIKHWPTLITEDDDLPEIAPNDIVVDAIFGIGLNKPAAGWVTNLIKHINNSNAFILSIDIPSGLYMDKSLSANETAINASYTLTFQFPKLPFFLPETGVYTAYWEVLDIGLDPEFIYAENTNMQYITKYDILRMYKPRNRFSHKGNFGHALMIGGSHGKIGAVLMASEATLHAGAGLVTAFVPQCGYQTIQTAFPEAMVITDANETHISNISFEINPTVIGVGVGIGLHAETKNALANFLATNTKPLVLDADAINIIAENKELLQYVKGNAIFTPHPKELERLVGSWKDDFEKLEKAKQFSKTHDVVVLIKGAYTVTVYHEQLFFNSTGNAGMATAGSGDVLTGIITGLVAQGYNLLQAALMGVYLHGSAGDLAVQRSGVEALTATDIIDFTGDAFLSLISKNTNNYQENPNNAS